MEPTAAIVEVLKSHPDGLSILDVTERLDLNRNSVARYLDVLKHQGIVKERVIGPTKLYTYENDVPYSQQIELFKRAMDAASCGITIADAREEDMPLVYVNEAFSHITGYSREEVLGKNCRFLQGTNRQQSARKKIRDALRKREQCTVVLENYRKDGTLFKNELHLAPVFDDSGTLTHYVGVQTVR